MMKVHLKNIDDMKRRMRVFLELERMQKQDEENVLVIRTVESPLEELDRRMQGNWLRSKCGMRELMFQDRHDRRYDRNGKNVFLGCTEDRKNHEQH